MTTRIAIWLVLGTACGTSAIDGGGDDVAGPDANPNLPPGGDGSVDGFTELIAGSWSLPAGDEGYRCVTRTLTEDVLITGFHTTAPSGTHHTALSVGSPIGPDGSAICGASDNRPTIIFGAGVGTPDLAMPAGLAVRVHAGDQLMLNLHVFNATDQTLTGHSGVSITSTTSPVAEAGIANTGKTSDLVVPPGSSTQVGTCTVPEGAKAFSVFPHMHKLGVHMRAIATTASGPHTLIDMPYTFENQRYYGLAPELPLTAGDQIRIECSYQNDTGATVQFGQSSLQEMCGLGIYITPPWADPSCGF
ncbi:MAG: hypothetical protein H6Q90_4060 [Deltaproteobacteria bacterium]|nr:hypothetical protein [Deltaproteobacteria bacterium]